MKQGKSLTELAAEIERQNNAKFDFVADTREVEFRNRLDEKTGERTNAFSFDVPVERDGGSFLLTNNAHDQLGSRLGIPAKYYDEMRNNWPDLLQHNVKYLMKEKPERRLIRTLDGNARAVLSDRFRPLDNFELAETVLPVALNAGAQLISSEITDSRLYLKFLTPKIQGEITKGDVVQAGMVISNSEVGKGSLSASALIYRLVCTNGMIAPREYGIRQNHTGKVLDFSDAVSVFYRDETRAMDDRAFWAKVRDIVNGLMSAEGFAQIIQKMREAKEDKIEGNPVKAIEVVQKQFRLNEGESTRVLRHLIEGADLSRYGLLNAITRTSQDIESYDRATELEAFGGQVIELSPSDWKSIATAQ